MPQMWFDAVTPWAVDNATGAVSGGSTRFSIDPDQAQKMVKGLEEAIKELKGLKRESELLTSTGAPGPDPYSGYATLVMRKAAGNEEGGYGWANLKAVEALEKTIESIKSNLAAYRETDDANKNAMGR